MGKLATEPPAFDTVHRRSRRALLLAEAVALEALRKSASNVHSYTIASINGLKDQTTAIMTVRGQARVMSNAITIGVTQTRVDARRLALSRINAELDLIADSYDPLQPTDASEDVAIAEALGGTFSAAWSATLIAAVLRWADSDRDDELAVNARSTLQQLDYRLQRIAATETSRAYNDEHDELATSFVLSLDEAVPGLLKRWDATLDARSCARCRAHDGETVLVGTKFSGGDEPGEMHANCRCMDSLVVIPVPVPAAA